MKRGVFITRLLPLVLLLAAPVCASAAEAWTSVRTRNFLLVGDAEAGRMRELAARLEEFREVCARLLDEQHFDESVPTTVLVFRTDEAYRPFKPLYQGRPSADVAGHFQPGAEGDYLLMSAGRGGSRGQHFVALHEYVHLLVKNSFRDAPLWFNEGLADYYGTLRTAAGGRKVTLGRPIQQHLHTLRRGALLPLAELFAVGRDSAHYNEPARRALFYAESWALVHMLLTDRDGGRRAQLSHYLELLGSGATGEEALRAAFKQDFAALENELRLYVKLAQYPEREIEFEKAVRQDPSAFAVAPLSAAEARAYLGDVLLQAGRLEEAEGWLTRALSADPNLARALTSLGALRVRQNRIAEAREHLARAVAADPRSHLAHYHYASALSREGADAHQWVTDYDPASAELMRAHLRRAAELAPRFVEAYRLQAFVNLVREERLEESVALLRQALAFAPRRQELALLLAQVHLRREEFAEARRVLRELSEGGPARVHSSLRAQARALLDSIPRREELAARRAASLTAETPRLSLVPLQPCDMAYSGPQHKRMRFEGEQRCGLLVSVECDEAGVVLLVSTEGGALLRLRGGALNQIRFVTYTAEVRTGPLTCGPREPANPVLVTFRANRQNPPADDGAPAFDGEAIAVEFVPREWHAGK